MLTRQETITCGICAKIFQRLRSLRAKYCSVRCARVALAKKPRKCKICGEAFFPVHPSDAKRGKFCSRKCYNKWCATRYVEIKCVQCGKKKIRGLGAWKTKKYRRGDVRQFCSRTCFWANNKTKQNPLRRQHAELMDHHNTRQWSNKSKEFRRANPFCKLCGSSGTTVDHVYGFSYVRKFFTGADPDIAENLISLCRPCHGKKTTAERHLMRGDWHSFWGAIEPLGYTREMFASASLALKASRETKKPGERSAGWHQKAKA